MPSTTLAQSETAVHIRQWLNRAAYLEDTYPETWDPENIDERIRWYAAALGSMHALRSRKVTKTPSSVLSRRKAAILPLGVEYYFDDSPLIPRAEPSMLESFCALTLTIDLSNARDESTPEDRYDARTCLLGLARAHQDRFLRLECIDDVKLQLEYATYALALLPAHAGAALLFIGSSLREIFDRFRDPSEIESSITILDYAIHLTQEDPQYCAMASFERARTQRVQHIHLGSAPLDVAITLMQEALQITPSHHPDRPVMLHHLAFLHHYQWEHSRQTEDAEAMLHLMEKALGICPMKHPFRSNILRGTAIAVFSQFTRSGILADLERSLGLLYEALTSLPCQPHPSRPRIYTDLANELRTRFEICGHEADIDDAIANGREAIGAFSSPVANLSCAVNLSTALGHRFDYKANIEDLEESVQLLRQTINTVPQGHPYRYLVASNLGGSLITRFEQFYSVADLNEGISLLREADRLQPPGYRHRGFTQFNLANALSLRFQSSASLNDLDEAIAIHDIWLTNVYHRSKLALEDYRFLQDVATLRRIRYEHHKELDDLALAIKYQEECVRIQPDANAEKGNMLSDLAKVYQMRSEHLNSVEDAQRAFSLQEQALSCTSLGRSRILFSMSKMYLNPTLPTKSTKKALHLYHNAIGDPHCVAQVRLLDGLQILPHLENAVQLEESGSTLHKDLLRAYRSTVHLLPRIAYFGLDVNSRLNALARAPVLATQAAAYATHIPDLEAAIEILEEGRAVFWAQCARLRSSFDQLPGELADELTKAARELELGARSVTAPSRADHEAMSLHEEQLAQRRRLSEHFEGLIAQARSLPGLDRFLLNDTFATFSMAAQKNPVVIFLATSNYCGALLLRDSTSRVEELKLGNKADFGWLKTVGHDVNKTRIATRSILQGRGMKRLDKAQANPLHVIWHEIVKPVVQALGYKKADGRRRPRLTLCSTGLFAHIPLHAASTQQEGCSNYFVSSYTPTLGALINAHKSYTAVHRADVRTLLAAVPIPFKWTPLPHAIAEIKLLKNTLPSHTITNVFSETRSVDMWKESASSAEVLDALPYTNILHLACHGYHNPSNPLDSGFVMRDKMLTVPELMELKLPNAFFACLSACETAKAAKDQPDQAVHLAATMLFAGFKSVIGTMWSMGDVDGPVIAKRVYEELFTGDGDHLDPDSIPYALDAAVQELRSQKVHMSRWAPYVHFGI